MPLPRAMARFNRVVTNRIFGPLGGRVPPWAVVEHVGRRSGRRYRTVLWAFPSRPRGDLAIALTYGPGSDWVRNIVAAGACRVEFIGARHTYSVELLHGEPGARLLPPILRTLLSLAGIRSVVHLHRTA